MGQSPQEAHKGLDQARIRRGTARFLIVSCVLVLLAAGGLRWLSEDPPFLAAGSPIPDAWQALGTDGWRAANATLLRWIEATEDDLEEGSPLRAVALPHVQRLLLAGGRGNLSAVPGQDGWLYFWPGLEALLGPGFLAPETLARRRRNAASAHFEPDPRIGLQDLGRQLAQRGIRLLVVPIPTKASILPRYLAPAVPAGELPRNPSTETLLRDLEAAGVAVFDPAPHLARLDGDPPAYLRSDSHWSPRGVEAVSRALAAYLRTDGPWCEQTEAWSREPRPIRALGDLGRLLEVPASHPLAAPEDTVIQTVQSPEGEPFRPSPQAEILMLGDSFALVFSEPQLHWGNAAGIDAQLAFQLGCAIDRLAVRDGGSLGARQRLARQLFTGRDRLAGKRLVIYLFAARQLSLGDWRPVPLPRPAATPAPVPSGKLRLRGRLSDIARTPDPDQALYRDILVALRLEVVEVLQGGLESRDILVYAHGLRDGHRTAVARLRPGELVELTLEPWQAVMPELESLQRVELADDEAFFLDAYWTLEVVEVPSPADPAPVPRRLPGPGAGG